MRFFIKGKDAAMTERKNSSIAAELFRFSMPLILSGILQQLYSWADAFIVGHSGPEGEAMLTAVGVSASAATPDEADPSYYDIADVFIGTMLTAPTVRYAYNDKIQVAHKIRRINLLFLLSLQVYTKYAT